MNKKVKFTLPIVAVCIALLAVISCNKSDQAAASTSLKVYLTDHPAEFDQVLVNVTAVEAKIDTSAAHCKDDMYGSRPEKRDFNGDDHHMRVDSFGYWKSLDVKAGSYDLLALRNGVDTLLATGSFEGTVRKIRITVSSVTVVKNGTNNPVKLPAETGNYLYVNIHREHMQASGSDSKLWVDFDVSRSIVEINGAYVLVPVLKPFCDRNFAALEGLVGPSDAGTLVKAFNSTDTATAIPDLNGHYRIRGLDEGIYTLVFDASNGYRDTTITGVQVSKGRNTRMPDIVLKK